MAEKDDINVQVEGADIVVVQPGTDYLVIYCRRGGARQLAARKLSGPIDFRVRAWTLANDMARDLGWI